MKVKGTGQGLVGSTHSVHRKPKREAVRKAGWGDDAFEAPVKRASSKSRSATKVQVGPAMVQAGARALERAESPTSRQEVRDAGWLLGGLTASLVVNVMHQFQTHPSASLDRGVERLGELCGALFLEFLVSEGDAQTIDTVTSLSHDTATFSHEFESALGLTPLAATRKFVDFIGRTEGKPRERMRGSRFS